ncbi:MAG: hypothetical protein RL632_485 [Bacteroidota bacterium]
MSIMKSVKDKILVIILTCLSVILIPVVGSCQTSGNERNPNGLDAQNANSKLLLLDSLFLQSNFEELTIMLSEMSKNGDTNVTNYLSYLDYISDTLVQLTKIEIQSASYLVSVENIKLLDDLDYYLTNSDLGWLSFSREISLLKCQYNVSLQKQFTSDIDKAYKYYKSASNIGLAGQIIAESQFFRLKFFRDSCFDKLAYDNSVKKINEVSNWIEKAALDAKYQAISDSQPEWVKMGMSFEEYQEWWAQRLTVGSDYMGGGCNSCGKALYRGKRGGIYYMNSKGNKQYVPRK